MNGLFGDLDSLFKAREGLGRSKTINKDQRL
jgi:hypothetical protein